MKGDDLRNLEYSKNLRHYEDECHPDATIKDLDKSLLDSYREKLHAESLSYEQLLEARGFLKHHGGQKKLTNAAVLLFAKNIVQFYPNCRIRFVRYDGTKARTGIDINIIRDYSIELPILRRGVVQSGVAWGDDMCAEGLCGVDLQCEAFGISYRVDAAYR